MTAMLSCDGCGMIVSDRPEDDDPSGLWWALSPAPPIGGGFFRALPTITSITSIMLGEGAEDLEPCPDPEPVPPPEPERHFCSEECGEAWFRRRREAREAAGA